MTIAAAVAVNNDGTSFKTYYTGKLHRLITKIVQELQREYNSNATQRTGHRQKVINGIDSQVTIYSFYKSRPLCVALFALVTVRRKTDEQCIVQTNVAPQRKHDRHEHVVHREYVSMHCSQSGKYILFCRSIYVFVTLQRYTRRKKH